MFNNYWQVRTYMFNANKVHQAFKDDNTIFVI